MKHITFANKSVIAYMQLRMAALAPSGAPLFNNDFVPEYFDGDQ